MRMGVTAVVLFGTVVGAISEAAATPRGLDIVVQGTTLAVLQDASGMRDSSWGSFHRIPSCTVEGYRNTATGTPMVHIVIADCHPGGYRVEAVSVGRALGLTAMAEGPGGGCGRGDDVKAPPAGESASWTILVRDSANASCHVFLERLAPKRSGHVAAVADSARAPTAEIVVDGDVSPTLLDSADRHSGWEGHKLEDIPGCSVDVLESEVAEPDHCGFAWTDAVEGEFRLVLRPRTDGRVFIKVRAGSATGIKCEKSVEEELGEAEGVWSIRLKAAKGECFVEITKSDHR
jgi:hypothetical protein